MFQYFSASASKRWKHLLSTGLPNSSNAHVTKYYGGETIDGINCPSCLRCKLETLWPRWQYETKVQQSCTAPVRHWLTVFTTVSHNQSSSSHWPRDPEAVSLSPWSHAILHAAVPTFHLSSNFGKSHEYFGFPIFSFTMLCCSHTHLENFSRVATLCTYAVTVLVREHKYWDEVSFIQGWLHNDIKPESLPHGWDLNIGEAHHSHSRN